MNIDEMKDRIARAEEIQRYTENRCEALEKENARLKEINTHTLSQLNLDNGELIIENEKLKKENAELKAVERMALYSKMSDQLARAKKLLKHLQMICQCILVIIKKNF